MTELPPTGPSKLAQGSLPMMSGTSVPQKTISREQEPEPEEQEDIYRGEPASPHRSRPVSMISSSSSSSSGWSVLGLRRGALGAILEMAINRWARASSDSSSSISSSASLRNRMPRRRTHRSSIATSHNTNTENIIRARRRAWQQGRVLPREFVLFLPALLATQDSDNGPDHSTEDRRVFRSASLSLVLSQLESAMKRAARHRKKQPKVTSPKTLEKRTMNTIHSQPSSRVYQAGILGNARAKFSEDPKVQSHSDRATAEDSARQPAWWLDVSSPSWSDMREIGKLLHLHPLTLEDILHQESREKFEVFPRLGYYFIVFRALDSERTRSNAQTQLDLTLKGDKTLIPFTDGGIGATNVYIVVFREGICTFHFEDISEHTLRIRNRIMQLEQNFHMSSDWIAHGILDSIVDQFFPLLNSIEQEVNALDDLVLSTTGPLHSRSQLKQVTPCVKSIDGLSEKKNEPSMVNVKLNEKIVPSSFEETPMWSLRFLKPFSWSAFHIRRHVPTFAFRKLVHNSTQPPFSPPPLTRMASTRRLVTSLTRLLGTKLDVLSQIRKRMTSNGIMRLSVHEQDLTGGVDMYLGDIQDHILTLQQSLAHYERMLSHSHPAYLSHIRISLAQAKAVKEHKVFMLSTLGIGIMAMQVTIGIFSTNIGQQPGNGRHATPVAPFNVYAAIVAFGLPLVFGSVVSLAHYWLRRAQRKYCRARQL